MTTYLGEAATQHASRYLLQLCKHWSHKFAVEFDPAHGRIDFDAETHCVLDADANGLAIRLEARDPARAEIMTGVVADHLKRFAFREELEVGWRAAG